MSRPPYFKELGLGSLMRAVMPLLLMISTVGCSSQNRPEQAAEVLRENAPAKAPAQAPTDELTARRVINTADLELLVDDIDLARRELLRLVDESKGFVGASETGGSLGIARSGRWIIRIPVGKYAEFLDAVSRLGEPLHVRTDAKDVTEQFVDLEARVKNKRVEEDRLQEHLKNSTGKLDEILSVEKELARVRGEIEQAQGHLQKLAGLADLATVTVSLRERKGYRPPAAPAFGATIGRTFGDSLDVLIRAGKGIVLFAVALAPWLPVFALIGGGGWLIRKRRKATAARGGAMATTIP